MPKTKNIENAIIKLAEIIDVLESFHLDDEIINNTRFRTRVTLIKEILNK